MIGKYKLIALIIALKRFKRNSVIIKKARYKMAQQVSLHPQTFNKYFEEAIERGWITDCGNCYKLIRFKTILREFCIENDLLFLFHKILRNKNSNFKHVLSELESYLAKDNIYETQAQVIENKKKQIEVFQKCRRTDLMGKVDPKAYRKLIKKLGKPLNSVKDIKKELNFNNEVVTSCRHTATKLGISASKANRLLNNMPGTQRRILFQFFEGCSLELFDHLRQEYPKATIYPMVSKGKTKVCFGSQITPDNTCISITI